MNDGILLIDKPAGVSSRYVDNFIQKMFSTRKVGHLGTLDPFATGLLIVGINKGTKFLNFLPDEEKTYIASLKLGLSSSTGDTEGEIKEGNLPPDLSEAKVKEALSSFLGKSTQIPPMASAIKVNGEALYKKMRNDEVIERKPRPIEVFSISLLQLGSTSIDFAVTVSKGCYIRTLGEDIAARLGGVGYLTSLRRVAVGKIGLQYSIPLEEASPEKLLDPTDFITSMKHLEMKEEEVGQVKSGIPFDLDPAYGDTVLLTHKGQGIAVYAKEEDGRYHCLRGLF